METVEFIRRSFLKLHGEIVAADYTVATEAELAHLFFQACWIEAKGSKLQPNTLRSEIGLVNGGRIDFGIGSISNAQQYEVLMELKVWVRPTHLGHMSKAHVPTRKRKECIKDAARLCDLVARSRSQHAGLLILERNSTHLRRLLAEELKASNISVDEEWLQLGRPSQGKHQEHVGLIWVSPNPALQGTVTSGASLAGSGP